MPTLPRSVFLSVFLLAGSLSAAEPAKSNPNIDQVKKDLDFLAGDECQGRGLETKGLVKAGDYIAEVFKEAGLKPAFADGYFQPFGVPAPRRLGTPISLTLKKGETTLEPKVTEGFAATVASAGGKTKAGLVFAGYGITSELPKYDDYAGLDVKGKLVVVLRRVPQANDPKGPFKENNPHAELMTKCNNATKHGAAGILFVNDAGLAADNDPLMEPNQTRRIPMEGPVLHLKREVVDQLLKDHDTTLAKIEEGIAKEMKPNSFELKGWEADAEVTMIKPMFPTRNVVGVCEGAGPLADETVVIGAHYDHLGFGEPGSFPGGEGKAHYGADDNASGTTGLLELVRRYGPMKNRQGRRIVFIAFSGEEQGLHGSKYYCEKPVFPLEKTVFMLNMDMIGRMIPNEVEENGKKMMKDRIVVYGTSTGTGVEQLVDETNKKFDFKLLKIAGGNGPSDHASFYLKQIPVLFFFTGTHKDYHRPSDTPDKINAVGLLRVVDFVQVFADHYTTITDRPKYLAVKGGSEDPTNPNPTPGRVSIPKIKFTPGNYGEEGKGVLVEAVEEGGPAAKGGMKAGDFIVEVAGQSVKSMDGYMAVMQTVVAEKPVEIVVLRKNEKVKLIVVPWK